MATSMIERIGKALALAERSTGAEAELAFAKAQELATLYAVDLEVARRSMADREKREEPIQKRIDFDTALATRNTKKSLVSLFSAVARPNDVTIDIAYDSTYVLAYGFPSDIEIVERMFAVIAPQMVQGANAYLATGEHRKETAAYWDEASWSYVRKPVDGRTARVNYYSSFVSRIGQRLREMREQAQESVADREVVVLSDAGVTSTTAALVLKEKEVAVRSFYSERSTARGSWRRSAPGAVSASASSAGQRDGSRARMGRETAIGGQRTALR